MISSDSIIPYPVHETEVVTPPAWLSMGALVYLSRATSVVMVQVTDVFENGMARVLLPPRPGDDNRPLLVQWSMLNAAECGAWRMCAIQCAREMQAWSDRRLMAERMEQATARLNAPTGPRPDPAAVQAAAAVPDADLAARIQHTADFLSELLKRPNSRKS
jgi:hypothetical protein